MKTKMRMEYIYRNIKTKPNPICYQSCLKFNSYESIKLNHHGSWRQAISDKFKASAFVYKYINGWLEMEVKFNTNTHSHILRLFFHYHDVYFIISLLLSRLFAFTSIAQYNLNSLIYLHFVCDNFQFEQHCKLIRK